MSIRAWFGTALVVTIGLAVSACSERPLGVLRPTPVGDVATSEVSMFVATTRRPSALDDGTMFSGERDAGVSFAEIGVSIPPVHKTGEVEWPTELPADPAVAFATTRVDPFTREEAREQFRERIRTGPKKVLVFVHGYNNTFADAVYRGAQIVHDSGAEVTPILFTWPSRAQVLAYSYDRESATFSRDALEALLQAVSSMPEVESVSILAHSMGNWVTLEALRQLAIRNGRIPDKITDVMLAAPDVDVEVAGTQIRGMGEKRPRITLFVSSDDRALAFSTVFWGSTAQLGAIDPKVEPYRSAIERLGITVVDLTEVESGDALNHGKFAASPEVVQLIGRRLASGQEIGTGQSSLGDNLTLAISGTAAKAGAAAGLVLTAPIAVVDQSARALIGNQAAAAGLPSLTPKPAADVVVPLESVDIP